MITIKKLFVFFTFILLLTMTSRLVSFAQENADINTEHKTVSSLPDTPRPCDAALFGEQDPQKVALATELYNNFLSANPDIFLLTHEGQQNI